MHNSPNLLLCFITGISLCLYTSCKSTVDEILPTENGAILNFNVTGIDEIVVNSMATFRANGSQIIQSNVRPETATPNPMQTLQSLENVDVFTSAALISEENRVSPAATSNNAVNGARSSVAPRASTAPMNSGIRYRIIIFNQDNTLVVNQVATAGTNPEIRVDGHRNYTWYALSVNETNAQVPDMNAAGIVAKAGLVNKDVLYASGNISTVDGDNYLQIVFRRLTARYRVKLDVRGLFGSVTGNTSLSLMKNANNTGLITMGDLDIRTAAFSSVERYPNTVVLNAQMSNVPNTPAGTTKYADFYTLDTDPITANNLKVRTNQLDISRDDNSIRSDTSPKTASYSNAYSPRIGATYELILGMVEQPVRVRNILWARTNLTYNSNSADPYRLKTSPGGSRSADRDTDYWNWMSATPTAASGNTDPCTLIYPNGTWRMPTSQEWQSLGTTPDERAHQAFFLWGAQFAYIWNLQNDSPNEAYDVNNLFIAFGGYRNTSGTLSAVPSGIATIGSGGCHYWSSTPVNNNQATAFTSSYSTAAFWFSWGNINYAAESKAEGRNIRCVRQVSYN